ncbi:hypothetical protein R1sor_013124 [Riccia sorocarpa]|uniref:Zinc finger CCCH domain-containing protein 19 n=1 Tax=Riccia sorocarpa TaxID=122646 RepID=A0ABD3H8X7_9MARC
MNGMEEVVHPSSQSASMKDDNIAEQATTKREVQEGTEVPDEQVAVPMAEDPTSLGCSGASTAVMNTELNNHAGSPSPDSPSKVLSAKAIVDNSSEPMNEDSLPTYQEENISGSKVDAMNVDKTSLLGSQDAEMISTVVDVNTTRTEVVSRILTTQEGKSSETEVLVKTSQVESAINIVDVKEGEVRSGNLELTQQTEMAVATGSAPDVGQASVEGGSPKSNEPQPVRSSPAKLPEEQNEMNTSKQESNGHEEDVSRSGKEATGTTASSSQAPADVTAVGTLESADVDRPEGMDASASIHPNRLDSRDVSAEEIKSAQEPHIALDLPPESETRELKEKIPAQQQQASDMIGLATLSSAVQNMHEEERVPPKTEDTKDESKIVKGASASTSDFAPASSSLPDVREKTELEREMELYEASVKEEEAKMLANMRSDPMSVAEGSVGPKEPQNERKRALETTPNEARKKRGKRVLSAETLAKEEEDVCFICFDGGDLVLCDRRTCPKAYHLTCIGRDTAFFEKKGAWICGWHFCTGCTKPANFQCYTCPTAYCSACLKKADFLCVRQRKGLCEECWPIVHMIENNETTNAEGVEVDFEDQETYECLFKDYWLDLKQRLQLTPAELDKDNKGGGSSAGYSETGDSDADDKGDVEDYNTGSDSGGSAEGEDKMDTSEDGKKKKRGKAKASTSPDDKGADGEPYIPPEDEDGMEDIEEDDVEEYAEDDGDRKSDVQPGEGWASKELIDFVKFMDEDPKKPLTKFEVTKLLWSYIKSQKLQDPRKKTQILCDERLQTLFGKKTVGQYEMIKYVQGHYTAKGAKSSRRQSAVPDEGIKLEDEPNDEGVDEKYGKIKDVKDKRRRRKGDDEKFERPDVNEFAAITPKNINLIYLRRQLLEELLDDPEFDSKVCNTFVRIRVPGMVSKSEMCYRLVQVVGTRHQAEHYKAGRKTTDVVLEILNLQKREDVTVDLVSNHEFSEEECQRLRQSIKCGLIKTLTVGDIEEKARDLQEAKVNDWFETERQRLVNLRDRASEKVFVSFVVESLTSYFTLRECVEKLQELNSPAFRAAKLRARPEVTADPRMDPNYESDGNEEKSKDKLNDAPATISERSPSAIGVGDKVGPSSILKSSHLESGRSEWDSQRSKPSWVESSRSREVERVAYDTGRSGDKMSYGRVQSYAVEEAKERVYDERDRGWEKEWVMEERETGVGAGWTGNGRNIRTTTGERWTEKVNIAGGIDAGRTGRSEYRGSTSLTGLNTPVYEGKPDWNKPRDVSTVPSMQSTFPLASQLTSTLSKAALEAAEKEKVWHYMDPTNTIQGPFSMEQLRKWNTTGYFPADLRVWRTNQPRDEAILLTDALAGRTQKERGESVRTVDVQSQPTLTVGAAASGYNKNTAEAWRDNGLSTSWVEKGTSDGAGRSTTSWAADRGRDTTTGRDAGTDLKWKSGSSYDTYNAGRNSSIYNTSPTRNSRVEAAARFDPANWTTRSDSIRANDKDSWNSSGRGTDGGYSKPGSDSRSSWGRGSSHSYRESGGSWNNYNEDRGDDSSRSMNRSRGSRKDVPCRFHQKGYCKRGDSCDFWHG